MLAIGSLKSNVGTSLSSPFHRGLLCLLRCFHPILLPHLHLLCWVILFNNYPVSHRKVLIIQDEVRRGLHSQVHLAPCVLLVVVASAVKIYQYIVCDVASTWVMVMVKLQKWLVVLQHLWSGNIIACYYELSSLLRSMSPGLTLWNCLINIRSSVTHKLLVVQPMTW